MVWELPQRDIGGLLSDWEDLVAQTAAMRRRGAAAERGAAAVLAATGIEIARPDPVRPDPDRCSFEITVGENSMAFSPAEVVDLIRELLRRSG